MTLTDAEVRAIDEAARVPEVLRSAGIAFELFDVTGLPMPQHGDCWRVSFEDGGRWFNATFANEQAYRAALIAVPGARVRSYSFHHPKQYTPPPKRRLPLLGDGPLSVRIRELLDDWTFGWFIVERMDHRAFKSVCGALAEAFDHFQEPTITSIEDAYAWARKIDAARRDGDDEDGYSIDEEFQDELNFDRGDYYETIGEQAIAFVRKKLASEGHRADVVHLFGPHPACRLDALPLPECSGVYFIVSGEREERVKIGKGRNIRKRFRELQTPSPYELRLVGYIETTDPDEEEARQHKRFAHHRVKGEWFRLADEIRLFLLDLQKGRAA